MEVHIQTLIPTVTKPNTFTFSLSLPSKHSFQAAPSSFQQAFTSIKVQWG